MSINPIEKIKVHLNRKNIPTYELVGINRTKRGKTFFKVSLSDMTTEQTKLIKKAEKIRYE